MPFAKKRKKKKRKPSSHSSNDAPPTTTALLPHKPSIEALNALPLPSYLTKLCPFPFLALINGYALTMHSYTTLSSQEFTQCFDLIQSTSRDAYASSSIRWSPRAKKKEMKAADLRYMLVQASPTSGAPGCGYGPEAHRVLGFMSFMLTYEDGYEVIYLYEIHLTAELRGQGLGKQLMHLFEHAGRRAGVAKAMCTVFISNAKARGWYERLGYTVDEYSPPARKMRNGVVKEADYLILSKALKEGVERAAGLTSAKKRKRGCEDGNAL